MPCEVYLRIWAYTQAVEPEAGSIPRARQSARRLVTISIVTVIKSASITPLRTSAIARHRSMT